MPNLIRPATSIEHKVKKHAAGDAKNGADDADRRCQLPRGPGPRPPRTVAAEREPRKPVGVAREDCLLSLPLLEGEEPEAR